MATACDIPAPIPAASGLTPPCARAAADLSCATIASILPLSIIPAFIAVSPFTARCARSPAAAPDFHIDTLASGKVAFPLKKSQKPGLFSRGGGGGRGAGGRGGRGAPGRGGGRAGRN